MLHVTVNKQEFYIDKGENLIELCREAGIDIPRFCYHERLSVAGNCRMCIVEIEKSPKPLVACALPVLNNLVVHTNTPFVLKARENVLETLLINHPLDCPICDQGGECDLQDQAFLHGIDSSRFYNKKRGVEDKYAGPLIKTIMTRCIHCTRCVRYSTEIAGLETLGTINRGKYTEISNYSEEDIYSEVSGNLIDLCPVGALTSKPYAFVARPWELRTVETIDLTDSLGSNVYVHLKGNDIVRIQPKLNEELNQEWLSDKSRFSYDAHKQQRLVSVYYKELKDFIKINRLKLVSILEKKLKLKTLFLIQNNIDFLSLQLIKNLNKFSKFYRFRTIDKVENNQLNNISLISTLDKADSAFLFGVNPKIESAILNVRLRARWQKGRFFIGSIGSSFKTNFAVNFICLNLKSFLDIIGGKHVMQNKISGSILPFFIFGKNFINKFNKSLLEKELLDINNNSKFHYLDTNLNNFGLHLLGLKKYTSKDLKWSNNICFINLDDIIGIRQILNKYKGFTIWLHTHGSTLSKKNNLVIPILDNFETEGLFLNSEGKVQKTNVVTKNADQIFSILKYLEAFYLMHLNPTKEFTEFTKYITYMENLSEINYSKIQNFFTFEFINNLLNREKVTKISSLPLKSNSEEFYLSSTWTKASSIMGECSSINRKNYQNF